MSSRRAFLRLSGAAALGVSLTAACAPATQPSTRAPAAGVAPAAGPSGAGANPAAGIALPTYVAFPGPQPDFAPSPDGVVPAGYLSFPQNLVKSSSGPVGKTGDQVSFLTYSINPSPAPVDQNPAWQQVNKDLGLD